MFLITTFLFVSLALKAHSEKLECPTGLQIGSQILRTPSLSALGSSTFYSIVCSSDPFSFDPSASVEIGIQQDFFNVPPQDTQTSGVYQFAMEQMTYKKSCSTRGNVPSQYFVELCRSQESFCGIEVPKVAGGAFNLTHMDALPCETDEEEVDDSVAMDEIVCPYHTDLNGILMAQESPKTVQYCGVCGNQLMCKTRVVSPPINAFLGKLMMYRCEKEPCLQDRLALYPNSSHQRSCGFRFEWSNSIEETIRNMDLIQDECVQMSSATSTSFQIQWLNSIITLCALLILGFMRSC
ncbi:hypothetical protein TCAL_14801 [Tigriopus californicus]|uniref:Uncharacterized protein n=1 Tax=Tigriopus californicus TaxID=6832 RepID=A0A553PQW6_TIGCA|nr:hypothetical protein TCAL_14801 [Tigriopus californicus]